MTHKNSQTRSGFGKRSWTSLGGSNWLPGAPKAVESGDGVFLNGVYVCLCCFHDWQQIFFSGKSGLTGWPALTKGPPLLVKDGAEILS